MENIQNKIHAINKNLDAYTDTYLKINDKILTLKVRLNNADFLYKYPDNKKIKLKEKIKYLENEKDWLIIKINECKQALKKYSL